MKYFFDTEFHEYKKKTLFNIKGINTIDLISIGIISEDGRAFYMISNEFDVDAAWKNDWIRENVLKTIHTYLNSQIDTVHKIYYYDITKWSLKGFKMLLKLKGSTINEIKKELIKFIKNYKFDDKCEDGNRYESEFGNGEFNTYYFENRGNISKEFIGTSKSTNKPEFYAYYADYDWIIFSWIFGTMMDLPKGYPMYCIDLKQEVDRVSKLIEKDDTLIISHHNGLERLKADINYPTQDNEHDALDDAVWNYKLWRFLNHFKKIHSMS